MVSSNLPPEPDHDSSVAPFKHYSITDLAKNEEAEEVIEEMVEQIHDYEIKLAALELAIEILKSKLNKNE